MLTGIVFTKTSLSREDIGIYETFLFLAGGLSFFWINGLLKSFLPLSGNLSQKQNGEAIFNSFLLISIFSLTAVIILYFSKNLISSLLLNNNEIPFLNYLFFYLIVSVPSNLIEFIYLIKKKNVQIIYYATISFFIQLCLVAFPPILGYGIKWAILGLIGSAFLRYVWLWIILFRNAVFSISFSFLKAHLRLGTPLILSAILSGSAQYVDGFIVTSKYDESTFAVFRYGARELPLALLLANALSNAVLPEFSGNKQISSLLGKIKRHSNKLMHILFPLSAILMVISYPIFPVIFNKEFSLSAAIFNIYLLLVISRLLFPQTILIGQKKSRPVMFASLWELLLNVFLSLVLVNYYGLSGIAFATFIAYLFEKGLLIVQVRKKLGIKLSEYCPVKVLSFYSIGLMLLFIIVEMIF